MTDTLGDHLKQIEKTTDYRLNGNSCVYARLDGRAFHTLTKGMERPNLNLVEAMIRVTEELVKEFHADVGYVQSDEISLVWFKKENEKSEFLFSGKIQKLASVLASSCAVNFIRKFPTDKAVSFDCRIVDVSEEDAIKFIYWRGIDCKKNAISMIASKKFSDKELDGKNTNERLKMLFETGDDISFYSESFLYGTFIVPATLTRPMTDEEKIKIPEKYHTPTITRTVYHRHNPDFKNLETFKEFWKIVV